MKQQYQSNIADHMLFVKNRTEDVTRQALDSVGDIINNMPSGSEKMEAWAITYATILDEEIRLSPDTWIAVLEDNDIGPTIEDRDQRYKVILGGMPKANGYPMRVCRMTFQPQLYIDGQWVGLEAIEDPEPEILKQQEMADEIAAFDAKMESQFPESKARFEEQMVEIEEAALDK